MPSMHGTRGSNSRHLVLETSALPTELVPYCDAKVSKYFNLTNFSLFFSSKHSQGFKHSAIDSRLLQQGFGVGP